MTASKGKLVELAAAKADDAPWKEKPSVSPGQLVDSYFQEARDFLQTKLIDAMEKGHISPSAASEVFVTFCKHYSSVLMISSGGNASLDTVSIAQSLLTITLASFTAGSCDSTSVARLSQAEKVRHAAHARQARDIKGSRLELNAEIIRLATEHKRPSEQMTKTADRIKICARMRPHLEEFRNRLRQEGRSVAALPEKDASLAKQLERLTSG